ncbi:MAG: hypothetical protein K6G16_00990 [Lachnospiraceae bacterium]|nr:hypothetical protein [Lachnospiraceae bacterium]
MTALKRFFTNNIGLKLLSLLFTLILWFLVTNLDDPTVTVRFYNIPVTIRNTSLITGQGKVYEVLDGTDVISSVAIVAPRSVADTFTRDNVIATADMSNLSSLDTLTISVSTNKYFNQVESITPSIDTVRLSIEESKTRTLALSAKTTGTLEEDYVIGTISTEQNVLRISGPESVVDQVAVASVTVDVTGFTSDINTDAEIDLYDADGNEITDNSLMKNIDAVRVTVSILQTKRVPITVRLTGEPAEGYLLTGNVEVTPDSVLLAGKGANLQNLEELTLSDSNLFDVGGLTTDLATSVNIRSMLPSGVSLGDSDFSGQVSVKAEIAKAVTREIEVPVSQIHKVNVPDGIQATIQTPDTDGDGTGDGVIAVSVQGLSNQVNALNARDITGTVDIGALAERLGVEKPDKGAYTVAVDLALPQGIYESESTRVLVYLEKE